MISQNVIPLLQETGVENESEFDRMLYILMYPSLWYHFKILAISYPLFRMMTEKTGHCDCFYHIPCPLIELMEDPYHNINFNSHNTHYPTTD